MHLKYLSIYYDSGFLGYPGYFRPENLGGMFKNFLLDDQDQWSVYLFGAAINTAEVIIGLFCVITVLHMSALVFQKIWDSMYKRNNSVDREIDKTVVLS